VGGEQDDERGVRSPLYLAARLDAGVLPLESQVEQDEVGPKLPGEPDGLGGGRGLADDLHTFGHVEEVPHAVAHRQVVVH